MLCHSCNIPGKSLLHAGFFSFFSAETGFVVWVLDACEISGAGLVKNSALFCQLFIIMAKSVSYKHTIRVSACQVTWAHLPVSLYLCSLGTNIQVRVEGCRVGCKNSDKGSKMKSKKLLEGTKVSNILPGDRSLICPP